MAAFRLFLKKKSQNNLTARSRRFRRRLVLGFIIQRFDIYYFTELTDYGSSHDGRDPGPERNVRTTEDAHGEGRRRLPQGDGRHTHRARFSAHAGQRERRLLRLANAAESDRSSARTGAADDHGAAIRSIAGGANRKGDSLRRTRIESYERRQAHPRAGAGSHARTSPGDGQASAQNA